MKKFLIMVMVLTLILTGCETSKKSYDDDEMVISDTFIVLERVYNFDDGAFYTVYDKETKVEYFIYSNGYQGGICPIYNADGTVKVYKGETWQKIKKN